jgi:hypothetical protein
MSEYDDSDYGYISSISELTIVSPDVVSSSEAVSCYILPSCEEEAMEQFSSSGGSPPVSCSWEDCLQELAAYKQQNNRSTNVPEVFPSNKPLGIWVRTQRSQYKRLQEGKNSAMTKEHIKSLNELDFEWVVSSASWERHLQELVTYKQQNNGSTNVHQRRLSNKLLGQWVQRQRHQYKLLQENKKSTMTKERIKSLEKLDFDWTPTIWEVSCHIPSSCEEEEVLEQFSISGGAASQEVSSSWEDRLQELATYKQLNKHTNVPQRCLSNKLLGQWVQRQRHQYKLLHENKKSTMTKERIKFLEKLDFDWRHGKAKAASWEDRLQELATYKQQNNGSTNVTQRCPLNKPLGIWVKTQRSQYKLSQKNKKSAMTDEHIKSLNELDFDWRHGKAKAASWEDRLQELAIYRQKNGHMNVSTIDAHEKPLGLWITRQRYLCKLFKTTGKGQMTDERIKSLNELGFEWKPISRK